MGRPPLGLRRIEIRVSDAAIARVHALVGERRLPEFVREAIEHELQRRENEQDVSTTRD